MAQENTKNCADKTTTHQANNAANQFSPPLAGYFETATFHLVKISLFEAKASKYIIATQPITV